MQYDTALLFNLLTLYVTKGCTINVLLYKTEPYIESYNYTNTLDIEIVLRFV